jgi:hypothetical protein
MEVPKTNLVYRKANYYSHYYSQMKENQRWNFLVSRVIMIFSILFVIYMGQAKAAVNDAKAAARAAVSGAVGDAKHLVGDKIGAAKAAAGGAIAAKAAAMKQDALAGLSASDRAAAGVHDVVNAKDAAGFNQLIALMIGTFITFLTLAVGEIAAEYKDKEEERREELEDQGKKDVGGVKGLWPKLQWYQKGNNKWFWVKAIYNGESFTLAAESVCLVERLKDVFRPTWLRILVWCIRIFLFVVGEVPSREPFKFCGPSKCQYLTWNST